ncbi:MAG: DUF4386 family protein [Candidatus Thorarchaeota archaeon]|jgi:hypothetical protein
MNQGLAMERVECARNAGVFILLRILIGMLIFLPLGTIFYIPSETMLPAIQGVKSNLLFIILIILALVPMSFFNIVISFPLNNVLKSVDESLSWHAARLRALEALFFIACMILLIVEAPLFYQAFLVSLVLYTLHLLLVGYLVYKSGYLSRVLGIFVIFAGVFGYLFQTITGIFIPELIWLSTIGGEIAIIVEIALAIILIYTAKTTKFDDDDSMSRVVKILMDLGEATTTEIITEATKESDQCRDRVPRTLTALESEGRVTKAFSKEKKGFVWSLSS